MGGLNHVLNLVLFSLTTIENDLFASVLFTICLRLIYWDLLKLVKPTSILIIVFFTAKINNYKSVLFFLQAVLHSCLNSFLVMSIPTLSSKMWLRFFRSWDKDKWNSRSLWLFDVVAWNSFEQNRNNQRCYVFL